MAEILILSPVAGARLRRCGESYLDAGSAYTFELQPRPVWFGPGQWATFTLVGLEIRHNAAVDLLVVPIVDNVEYASQQMALTLPVPGAVDWGRSIVEGRFFLWGRKITFKVLTNTLPGQFHVDGMYVDCAPQPTHVQK